MKYLLHADGALPNLALMKLATYFQQRREKVLLIRGRSREVWDEPGEVYGSSIFQFSESKRAEAEKEWGPIRWGGTGVRIESSLTEIDPTVDWDTVKPDYSIYPQYQWSIGFTQRGCRLSCKFCVVPKKEGKPKSVATIWDVWRGDNYPRRVVLLDNDFFGQLREQWAARIEEMIEGCFRVSFCQGINIRQVDEESAKALARVEYRDNEFQRRRLYTAWDNLGDETVFKRGVEILRSAGIPPKHLMVYMLVGFAKGETMEAILHRFEEIRSLGCLPYPMVFNNADKKLKAFQRWAVTGLYKKVPWLEYRDPRLGSGSGKGIKIA